jgi:hypothetical protein
VAGDVPQITPEKQQRELLRDLREGLQLLDGSIAALGVPRAQGRRDHLLEQAGLAVGRRAERA